MEKVGAEVLACPPSYDSDLVTGSH